MQLCVFAPRCLVGNMPLCSARLRKSPVPQKAKLRAPEATFCRHRNLLIAAMIRRDVCPHRRRPRGGAGVAEDPMLLWFVIALLTAAAVFAVLWPLSRTANVQAGSDIAVYRDQLDEVERDLRAGLIGERTRKPPGWRFPD